MNRRLYKFTELSPKLSLHVDLYDIIIYLSEGACVSCQKCFADGDTAQSVNTVVFWEPLLLIKNPCLLQLCFTMSGCTGQDF